MKVIFLTRRMTPHVGGVENHIQKIATYLEKKEIEIKIISEKDIFYPRIKFFGLLFIWFWMLRNFNIFLHSDLIHVHDAFLWYLPLRLLLPFKPVLTTFHGWEGKWPIPKKFIFIKQLSNLMSNRTVAVGAYIEKYYNIKVDKIIYGGREKRLKYVKKVKGLAVFLGRLERDTGLTEFLTDINKLRKKRKIRQIIFIGDGELKNKCLKHGMVTGFVDPERYLKKAELVIPAGYLSYIEARQYGCKILTYANNPLKNDYWQEIKKNKSIPLWSKLANEYLDLYNSIK